MTGRRQDRPADRVCDVERWQALFLCAFYGFFDFRDCFVGVFTCFDDCDNQVNQSLELFVRHFVHAVSFPALASLGRAVSRDGEKFLLFAINKNDCEELAAKFRGKNQAEIISQKFLEILKHPERCIEKLEEKL